MRILKLVTIMLLFSTPHYGVGQVEEPDIDAMARAVQSVPVRNLTPERLPEEFAEEVIERLRERGNFQHLIRLRDERAMQEFVDRLVETEARHLLAPRWISQTYSPHFIQHLGPLLFLDDSTQPRWVPPGDVDFGFTLTIAQGIGGIIGQSPEFSEELQEWFRSGRYRTIDGLRQWWRENETHFQNEDYHLVRPVSWHLEEDTEEPAEQDDENERDAPDGTDDGVEPGSEPAEEETRVEMEEEHAAISSDEDGSA